MPLVQIERVIQKTKEEKKPNYTVHEWSCSGWLDGEYASEFTVKTLSTKAAGWVVNGFQFQAEIDEFHGRVAYKIPKSMYSNNVPQAAPPTAAPPPAPPPAAPAPQAPPPAAPPPPPPAPPVQASQPSGYTLDDLENLLGECWKRSSKFVNDEGRTRGSLAATLFIQATRNNIKVSAFTQDMAASAPNPDEFPPPESTPIEEGSEALMGAIHNALTKGGLMQRADGNVPDNYLIEWWNQADGNETQFVIRVNSELQKAGL